MIPGASFTADSVRTSFLSGVHPAVRLAALVPGLAGCFLAGPAGLAVTIVILTVLLARTGLPFSAQASSLRPWTAAAGLVLLVHAFTSTECAPLWHPSWCGLAQGGTALLRVVCTIGWLGLFARTSSLDDLLLGGGWWLRPLRRAGVQPTGGALVLAVALGTAPGVLGEGRRIETVMRLRGSGSRTAAGFRGRRRWVFGWTAALVDRARVLAPLLETLARRADTLSLSLRMRRPGSEGTIAAPPAVQLILLALWLAALVWLALERAPMAGPWGIS